MTNDHEEKAYAWKERCADADCFTPQNAYIFGHVIDYLGRLKGSESKKTVASGVKRVVEKCAPQYMGGSTPADVKHTEEVFQTLVDDTLA